MNKIVVLSDNRQIGDQWLTEHGLSVYLDTGKTIVLLDTGASSNLIRNALRAGINLQNVDYVFLSHGHIDHTGGLDAFLKLNSKAVVLTSPFVFSKRYFSIRNGLHEIGTSIALEKYPERFRFIDKKTIINEEISLFHCKNSPYPAPKANMTLFAGDEEELMADDFCHELIFSCGLEKQFVYTGCAHHGILNTLESVHIETGQSIEVVLGGFHLLDSTLERTFETPGEIKEIGRELNLKYPETRFITGHCTGNHVLAQLNDIFSNRIELFHTGFNTHF